MHQVSAYSNLKTVHCTITAAGRAVTILSEYQTAGIALVDTIGATTCTPAHAPGFGQHLIWIEARCSSAEHLSLSRTTSVLNRPSTSPRAQAARSASLPTTRRSSQRTSGAACEQQATSGTVKCTGKYVRNAAIRPAVHVLPGLV